MLKSKLVSKVAYAAGDARAKKITVYDRIWAAATLGDRSIVIENLPPLEELRTLGYRVNAYCMRFTESQEIRKYWRIWW